MVLIHDLLTTTIDENGKGWLDRLEGCNIDGRDRFTTGREKFSIELHRIADETEGKRAQAQNGTRQHRAFGCFLFFLAFCWDGRRSTCIVEVFLACGFWILHRSMALGAGAAGESYMRM